MITEKEIDLALCELNDEFFSKGFEALPLQRGAGEPRECLVIEQRVAETAEALIEEIGLPLIVRPIRGTGLAEIKPCIF
jgi:carbamoylphosphate synthase large subunit